MGPVDRIENLRDRIEESDEISDDDRAVLFEFDDALALLGSEYSDHRHEKLLRHTTIMAEEVGGVAAALDDRGVAEDIVRWINRNYDNEETNQDYRVAPKVLGRRAVDENGTEPPDSLDWTPSGTSSSYDPSPEPSNMLGWDEDVLPMIDETHNDRDAAAIALQFDAGSEGGSSKTSLSATSRTTNTGSRSPSTASRANGR